MGTRQTRSFSVPNPGPSTATDRFHHGEGKGWQLGRASARGDARRNVPGAMSDVREGGCAGWPELRFVRAGTLDTPSSVAPDIHIFTRSKLPWVELPPDVPAVEIYYDRKELWPTASNERLDTLIAQCEART